MDFSYGQRHDTESKRFYAKKLFFSLFCCLIIYKFKFFNYRKNSNSNNQRIICDQAHQAVRIHNLIVKSQEKILKLMENKRCYGLNLNY